MDHDPFYFSDLAILTRPAKGLQPDNVKNIKGAADSSTEGKVDKRNANQAISFIPGQDRTAPSPHGTFDINQGKPPLLFHHLQGLAQRLSQFPWFRNRADCPMTIGTCHGGKIYDGILDTNSDDLILHGPSPELRNSVLMLFVVVVGMVATDYHEERDFMVSRCPKSAYGKKKIAVRLKIDADFSRALVCQRRSQRGR